MAPQPTQSAEGGVWIGENYYVAGPLEVLAGYCAGQLAEIEVNGRLFVPAVAGTLRCTDCKHTMSQDEWERWLGVMARTQTEYVELDCAGICPECARGVMEEVA